MNRTVSYLANDLLGSPTVSLGSNGIPGGSVLFGPYGAVRYTNGTMPTTYAFTGQRADAVTGLDYYGARYYDPVAGQFTSGDAVLPNNGMDLLGLSRYAYVDGNPTARTDPTGHRWVDDDCGGCTYGNHGFWPTAAWRRWADQVRSFQEQLREQSEARRRAASRRWADFFRLLDDGGLGGVDSAGPPVGAPALGEAAAGGGGAGLRAFFQLTWDTVMGPAYDGEYFVQRIQGRFGGDSSAASRGRALHEAFKAFAKAAWEHNVDWRSEPTIEYGTRYLKPDAVYDNDPVELKPNTSSGRSAGQAQVRRYMSAMGSKTGYLVLYDADGGFTVQVVRS